jgi:hypothetical protein
MATLLRRPWLLALLVGLVAAGAAGLVSAHNGDPTQIHACVNQGATPRGQVIIYSAPGLAGGEPATSTCGTRGTPVDWGQTGGVGATGPSGVPGPSGPSGPGSNGAYAELLNAVGITIPVNGVVQWTAAGPSAGVSPNVGAPAAFIIQTPGTYQVYATCGTSSASTTLGFTVNGIAVAGRALLTNVAPAGCGSVALLLTLQAGDLVSLVNQGPNATTLAPVAPNVPAAIMNIVKVS